MSGRSPIRLLAGCKLGGVPLWSYAPIPEIPVAVEREIGGEAGVWDLLGSYDAEASISARAALMEASIILVGSSAIMSSGFTNRQAAKSTLCSCPPLSS